jgi:hypothetical protein
MPINRSYFTFPFLNKIISPTKKHLLEKKPVVDMHLFFLYELSVWLRFNLHANNGIHMHSIEFYKPAINNSFVSGF